jgi:hypothetical protein
VRAASSGDELGAAASVQVGPQPCWPRFDELGRLLRERAGILDKGDLDRVLDCGIALAQRQVDEAEQSLLDVELACVEKSHGSPEQVGHQRVKEKFVVLLQVIAHLEL